VTYDDAVAVSQFVATPDDNATRGCRDWRPQLRNKVDTAMLKLLANNGMFAYSKRRGNDKRASKRRCKLLRRWQQQDLPLPRLCRSTTKKGILQSQFVFHCGRVLSRYSAPYCPLGVPCPDGGNRVLNTERRVERRREDAGRRSLLRQVPHPRSNHKSEHEQDQQTSSSAPMRPRWRPVLCPVRIWNIEPR
jgi:hypothetical protein